MKTDDTKGKGYGDKEVQFMCLGGMPVQPPVDDSFSATRLSFKVNETERSLGMDCVAATVAGRHCRSPDGGLRGHSWPDMGLPTVPGLLLPLVRRGGAQRSGQAGEGRLGLGRVEGRPGLRPARACPHTLPHSPAAQSWGQA